ncbi:MAG: UbiA family prenyltransferase [Stappiaceae bacterium]
MSDLETDSRNPLVGAPLHTRLWAYQADRFPLGKTAILLGVFSSASISVSAHLADRGLPHIGIFVATWLIVLIIFFQMRACDEYKDLDDDQRYRPERPIPSGLVSLKLILSLAASAGFVAIGLTVSVFPPLLVLLLVVWLWLGLMTVEFFVPVWLKRQPFLYLVSHMAIMPLIDLFVTGAEWLPFGSSPPAGLWIFLCLSFVNGCVLELGRKVWAPENERTGVETYSALMGPVHAVWTWSATCVLAWILLVFLGARLDVLLSLAVPSGIMLCVILVGAARFARESTPARQSQIDTLAGLWVLICYCLAGFAPFIAGG